MNESTQPKAKKSLGQHFLRHESICNRIASLLLPKDTDNVIEIGPGPGALTRAIEAQPHARLVLLEKDSHWAAERQRLGAARTQAVLTDALRFDWSRITPDNPWKIIGNLPYNVASPMMWDLFSRATGLVRAAFMVQKEVGQRLAAGPGNGHYGALSVWVQSFARPRMEFIVGPGAFSPPPKVDSAFVCMPWRDQPAVQVGEIVNTVGAGDALFSGFLHHFARGYRPLDALARAQVFASAKIRVSGAANGFPAEKEMESLCREYAGRMEYYDV